MDTAILKMMSIPRTIAASDVQEDNCDETVTLLLDDSSTTVTKEMFLVLIKYYYSILRYLFLDDGSHMPTFLENEYFILSDIRTHVEELQSKGATPSELQCFSKIERLVALKSPPTKQIIIQGFKELRLLLTANIDSIITTIARTTLEDSEKCINVGTKELSWLPWAQRLQQSSTYMTRMENESFIDTNMIHVNKSFQILCNAYQTQVQSSDIKESLITKLVDPHILRVIPTKK